MPGNRLSAEQFSRSDIRELTEPRQHSKQDAPQAQQLEVDPLGQLDDVHGLVERQAVVQCQALQAPSQALRQTMSSGARVLSVSALEVLLPCPAPPDCCITPTPYG